MILSDIKIISICLAFLPCLIANSCNSNNGKDQTTVQKYHSYCGSCHIVPDPSNLPKYIWRDLLPEMGARLGIRHNNYNPYAPYSMTENLSIRRLNIYPENPLIDSADWLEIFEYVMSSAPDSLPQASSPEYSEITQFKMDTALFESLKMNQITYLESAQNSDNLIIGNYWGNLVSWPNINYQQQHFNSALVDFQVYKENSYFLEIGIMNPSQQARGVLHKLHQGERDTVAKNLHRPVFFKAIDLDGSGSEEIIVCEFGDYSGQLSLLHLEGDRLVKKTLYGNPGCIKVACVDWNKDGLKDILLLSAQGNDGIFLLTQTERFKFSTKQLVEFGPEYGASWFELIDYNQDGHLDVVMVNGDNADFSQIPKPYHGLRIMLNDGMGNLEEAWFHPINGATRVVSEDFDNDGDTDFAVIAHFSNDKPSFIYLQNLNKEQYSFRPYVFNTPSLSPLVMEKGDFDVDGDIDLIIGSYYRSYLKSAEEKGLAVLWNLAIP